ncbi:MAG: 16S rRNA (adenine(1518)-N(6)/adenine(1519)-N(6))-dimethyltransferase RsmA [Thermoplasmata archaeon]|nr:16S rRNA (adenine(1518)-N(6)/adenine(1519)-N(6))-dimethyltransferase RsmA [Thermoplasmata archaeon]
MRVAEARDLLLHLGVRAQKSLGQHFLIDDEVVKRQVQYASIGKGETVLEIGPGLGFLTSELLDSGAKVVAIESDRKFCEHLRNRFSDSIELIEGDATRIDLPAFDKVVSNIPYQISSEITFKILERRFKLAVIMYQKEFAERLVAGEASAIYGRLSVMAAYHADCEILEVVSRRSFWPEPKVDSALVMMRSRPPKFQPKDERLFVDVVRILFSHRRKMISNGLIAGAAQIGLARDEMRALVPQMPYAEERVEMLTPEEIGEIADFFWDIRKHKK